MRRGLVAVIGLGAAGLLAGGAVVAVREGRDAAVLAEGRAVYAEHCAACHGADLEGAEDWRMPGPDGRLPAPPHDATGHTWHHPDPVLFAVVKHGTAAVVGGGYESDMPGFEGVLDDDQIRAVLAYIASTWPEELQAWQRQITEQAARTD